MAIISGTATSYSVAAAGGNREDLEDVIWDLFREENHFLTSLDKVEASGTFHEWTLDTLEAVTSNAQLEGNQESYTTAAAPTRVGNYCQISDKLFLVSRTQEKVAKAGRRSEIQRLAMKKMRALKNDIEQAIVQNQASSAGGSNTARSSAGMESWIATNVTYATTNSGQTHPAFASGVQGASTAGSSSSLGVLSESELLAALQDAWSNGGMVTDIVTGPANKQTIDGFSGNATKNVDMSVGAAKPHAIVQAVDVYVSDFGNHKLILHKFVRTSAVLCIDPSYWAIAFLDRPFVEPYAKTSDGEKRHIAAEWALVSRNEAANGIVDSIG